MPLNGGLGIHRSALSSHRPAEVRQKMNKSTKIYMLVSGDGRIADQRNVGERRTRFVLMLTMLLGTSCIVGAQHRIKSVSLEQAVTTVAIDRPGDLYVTLHNGKVVRVDADGNLLVLPDVVSPTLFDPRDGSRLFAYYRPAQRYAYHSSLQEMSSHHVDSAFAIDPWLVCPSGDYNIWIADAADNTIRKVNTATSRIDAEISFQYDVRSITYMREYQGFLFVLYPTRGIVVFSAMGRELRAIGKGDISWFNFLGEELYYAQEGRLHFFNLFNTETRTMELPAKAAFSLVTDTRLFSVNKGTVEIFVTPR